jgi:hypothetical protein
LIIFYLFTLFLSGLLPVIFGFQFLKRKRIYEIQLVTLWFLIRVLTDCSAFVIKTNFDCCVYPFFHISVLLEALALITFFISLDKNPSKKKQWIYLIPIAVFLLETFFTGSLFQVNRLSIICYNVLMSVLMLRLLTYYDKIDGFLVPIVKALFVFHAVSFIYSLFEHVLRINSEMMSFVYPGFLLLILSLNLFFTYYLWSTRKN